MQGTKRIGRERLLLFATTLAMAFALFVSAAPPAARAFSQAQVTLDQETGGQLTGFTIEPLIEKGDHVTVVDLTFPAGFDLTQESANSEIFDMTTLAHLPVHFTQSVHGQTVELKFSPSVALPVHSTDAYRLHMKLGNVLTPHTGGTYALGVSYESSGTVRSIRGITFSYSTPTVGQDIAKYLNGQAWVKAWNSVNVFNLFLQPQIAVLAFTTVWTGWLVSLGLVILAFPMAIVGGLALAFMKMSKIPPLRWIANIYINVVRGTPLFLQIAIVFTGFAIAGLHLPWFGAGVGVLAFNSSAYLAEIFRAGIQSINKGQFEAASSLGMTYPQSMAFVIIPQTVKRVLPTMTSEFILLFKDTALLSAVGVFELMLDSNNIVARTGNITPFMVAAVYYLIVTVPLINVVGRLEARLAQSEGGQTPVAPSKRGRTWMPSSAGPVTSLEASSIEHESR